MKKVFKMILRIFLAVICLALVASLCVFGWSKIHYRDFYKDSQRCFAIPGLSSGFVPQGFDYDEDGQFYLISGYMKDTTQSSRIYVVGEDGSKKCTELLDENGEPFTGHCGGVAINGDYLYLPSDKNSLVVYSLTEVLEKDQAKQVGTFETGERTSFCSFENGYLITGAFYRAGSYETPEYHHLTTPAGDENHAIISIYKADEEAVFGVDPNAVAALSVRDQVQGIVVTDDGKIVLSTSWGLNSSELYLYEMDDRVGSVQVNGAQVPLYYLDSANLLESVTVPPMSEEMVYKDGRVYVLTESACTKYLFGNFIDGRYVFAYQF